MTDLPHSQRVGRILRMAAEEVLGEEGLRSVLVACNESCQEIGDGWKLLPVGPFSQALEQVYGVQPGRGIALRVGRACFPYGLREYGDTLGLTQTSVRLLPFPKKLKALSASLASLLLESSGCGFVMEESDEKLLWHLDDCPVCHARHTEGLACHLAVGLAEESLYWLSGGKIFQVEETACIARGDAHCTLQFDRVPLS
jgi:predicted hydrocarbon binding protein